MNYELAKELQKAKFPKSKDWVEHSTLMKGNYFMVDGYGVPNLSELIEACGEMFEYMERIRGGTIPELKWSAVSTNVEKYNISYGHTPEEAVANLYLAINKTND